MKKFHHIQKIEFSREKMKMQIDGKAHIWDLGRVSKKLLRARDFERREFNISPSGYGIHWPLIDEDLSIDGLLKISQSTRTSSVYHL